MEDDKKITGATDEEDAAKRVAWTRDMMRRAEELHAELLRQWPDWPNESEPDDER